MDRDMSADFGIAAILMALLAIGFVAAPLVRNNRRFGLIGIAVGLPIFSAGLYGFVGSPQAATVDTPAHRSTQNKPGTVSSGPKSVGSVASMIDGLAARLKDNPDDGKSWLLLARSYQHLKQTPEARHAYEKAVALGQYEEELAALSASPAAADAVGARVFGSLALSERSKTIALPTDTVFIFARAVGGLPMPVAILRKSVSDLPVDFVLNDGQAMSADMKLSNYAQVIVTARISRSGVTADALQGLEAKSEPIVVAENRHLNLIIE